MRDLIDIWVDVQTWLFETLVSPVLFNFGLMEWYEPAFNAVEIVMLGLVQIRLERYLGTRDDGGGWQHGRAAARRRLAPHGGGRLRTLRTRVLAARIALLVQLHELILAHRHLRYRRSALGDGIGDCRRVQLNGPHRIVVAGDHVFDAIR